MTIPEAIYKLGEDAMFLVLVLFLVYVFVVRE